MRQSHRYPGNLFTFSDSDLSGHLELLRQELERRARATAAGQDGLPDHAIVIKGQEYAKRAVTVAAAGHHSLLLIGCPGTAKTMLRALAYSLSLHLTFEAWPCACGYRHSPVRPCACTPAKLSRWLRGLPTTEMVAETANLSASYLLKTPPGVTESELRRQLGMASKELGLKMSPDGATLLKAASDELGLKLGLVHKLTAVAGTIARLDHATQIKAHHVAEAVGYRPTWLDSH